MGFKQLASSDSSGSSCNGQPFRAGLPRGGHTGQGCSPAGNAQELLWVKECVTSSCGCRPAGLSRVSGQAWASEEATNE